MRLAGVVNWALMPRIYFRAHPTTTVTRATTLIWVSPVTGAEGVVVGLKFTHALGTVDPCF